MITQTKKAVLTFAGMALLAASGLYSGCAPVEVKLDQARLQEIVGDLTEEEARQVTGGPCKYDPSKEIPRFYNSQRCITYYPRMNGRR